MAEIALKQTKANTRNINPRVQIAPRVTKTQVVELVGFLNSLLQLGQQTVAIGFLSK